ncbi:hypothetical protein CBF23_010105 [Marinomonas agarivorans]|nr:hypothetical protein CBF23_010105 [Marinomonas agarivorans]
MFVGKLHSQCHVQSSRRRSIYRAFMLVVGFTSLMSCQSTGGWHMDTLAIEYRGLWQSNGYGYFIDASGPTLKAYNITADVCVRDSDIEEVFYSYASQQIEGGELVATADGQYLYLKEPFEEYQMQLTRLDRLPAQCRHLTENTPMANFDALSSYMQTHYAFFELYGVDWPKTVASYRPKVTDTTSEADLFRLFSDMLAPIQDAHVSLRGIIDGDEVSYEPEISPLGKATQTIAEQLNTSKDNIDEKLLEHYWVNDIHQEILQGQGVMAANDWIQYGIVDQDIGYMAIASTYDYAGGGINDNANTRRQLKQVLDQALMLFNDRSVKAVLLDLSINFGGHSFPAMDIAARFATRPTQAFSKKAYDAVGLNAFPIQVTPTHQQSEEQPYFHGPVYVLASSATVSGGEEVVLALRALPNVTVMGERTRGALSDILEKTLPNGWRIGLSNEIYMDENDDVWEGDGIPPDVEMPVFDPNNPFKGHLEAVNQVIENIHNERS